MSQFFTSGGQSIRVSALASVLPMNIQDWFPLGWTGWISLLSKGLGRVFSKTTIQKLQFFGAQLSLWSYTHIYMTTGKSIALTRGTYVGKVTSMLFNMLSRFSSVQSLSRVRLFPIPWIAARQASLFITISWSSLRLTSIESMMPSSHLILCRPLLLLPSIFPSIRIFSNESALCIKWPKYWSFSFNISPWNEHPGLILQDGLVGSAHLTHRMSFLFPNLSENLLNFFF